MRVQVFKIDWKEDSKNLTKLYPRVSNEPDDVSEGGSFFNFFETSEDPFDVSGSVTGVPGLGPRLTERHYVDWGPDWQRHFPRRH